jgi:predicted MFS family arabinose efflux permease
MDDHHQVRRLMQTSSLTVLRQPLYRRWAMADLASSIGTWLQIVGAHVFVLQATGSATRVGVTVLLTALPSLFLAPWAGALVDRVPARRVLITVQSLQAVVAVVAAVLIVSGGGVVHLQVIALLSGLLAVAAGPAIAKFNLSVIAQTDLPKAIACGSVSNSLGRIIGTAMAGILAASIGVAGLYVLDAISFVIVVATIISLRPRRLFPVAAAPRESSGIRAGFRYIAGRRHLVVTLLLGLVLGSIGRNFQVSMAAMSADSPNSAAAYGMLSSLFGVGALIGALAGSALAKVRLPVMLSAAAMAAGIQAVSAVAPSMAVLAGAFLVIAIGAVITDTGITTVMQAGSSTAMRGRVSAAQGMVSAAAGGIGAPVVGAMSERLGVGATLGINGVLVFIACLAAAAALAPSTPKVGRWGGGSGLVARFSLRRAPVAATCSAPSGRSVTIPCASSSARGVSTVV